MAPEVHVVITRAEYDRRRHEDVPTSGRERPRCSQAEADLRPGTPSLYMPQRSCANRSDSDLIPTRIRGSDADEPVRTPARVGGLVSVRQADMLRSDSVVAPFSAIGGWSTRAASPASTAETRSARSSPVPSTSTVGPAPETG